MSESIFKNHGLSITESRKIILAVFQKEGKALAHADIERKTKTSLDRVTVYRTLQTFLEKGIIHQVPTTDNSQLYALCGHSCGKGAHNDDHVHFECETCGSVTCIDEVIVPMVKLPKGFKFLKSSMVVRGHCALCK
jgi:Fur family ferric uptake transcriptional regulator